MLIHLQKCVLNILFIALKRKRVGAFCKLSTGDILHFVDRVTKSIVADHRPFTVAVEVNRPPMFLLSDALVMRIAALFVLVEDRCEWECIGTKSR